MSPDELVPRGQAIQKSSQTPNPASLLAPRESGPASNSQLAELLRDLIGHSIQFLITLAVGLIEERLL